MEGPLVMFDCTEQCFPDTEYHHHGARYRQPLSREFPHFEVSFDNSKKDFSLTAYMGC